MSDHTLEKIPATDPSASVDGSRPDARLTVRCVVLGMLLAMIVSIWVPYCMYIMRGPRMTLSHMSVAALILFFIVIFFVQIPLQRWKPSWAFSKTELMVLFSMTLMASTIPGKAFVDYFLGLVSTPNYYVSPENRWQDVFFEILPGWLVAPPESARAFYEGRLGASDPWDGWITPLFWWMNMLAAMFLVTSCITGIFRRQWV
ncbi:MAG: hypothetical protein HOH43_10030, partial [Candidatus Latescibacteria bacterium]|nr:hypothetical protein [Candidatus Latescibacterota bacterium]